MLPTHTNVAAASMAGWMQVSWVDQPPEGGLGQGCPGPHVYWLRAHELLMLCSPLLLRVPGKGKDLLRALAGVALWVERQPAD